MTAIAMPKGISRHTRECKKGYALHHGERSPNMHKPYNNSSLIVSYILLRSAT